MFRVREATGADRPEIEALIDEMIPGCDVDARWRWLYETNPGGRAITWLAIAGDQVAGCTSFFPFRLWLDGREIRGALGGDGYVRPAFRRKGVGALLHDSSRFAMRAHRIECMYGAPGAMNVTPLKHGGSRECGTVIRWARPLRARGIGAVAAALADPRLHAQLVRFRARLEEAPPFDTRIDDVWLATRPHLKLAAVRDAAFYTWRFHEAPAERQTAFVILDDDRAIGCCALEPLRDGRTLRIVDLTTPPEHWHTCLRAIAVHAARLGAELLDIKLLATDGRARQMWRSLFVEREGKPFLCMLPKDGDRRLVDPTRWFYTQADSDLDDHS